jgi:hypothetical protein
MSIIIRRRRFTLKNKSRFARVIMLFVLMVVFMSMYITAGASQAAKDDYEEILVMQGDTLWSIAQSNFPEKDIRAYIYDIKQLNGLNDDYIYEGQKLKLP